MEAIVLAGGLGTRLRSVVANVPKPMADIAGRPFLELLLLSLKAKGVTRAILSIGHMSDVVTSYFREHPVGLDLAYEIEAKPLGTGGALVAALCHATRDHVLVINGDTYIDLQLKLLESMWPGDKTPIVVARPVPDTERFGRLEIVDGRIIKFIEKGTSGAGFINAGCYIVPTDLFAGKEPGTPFSFETDFLARLSPSSLRAFICNGQFIDIGVPEDYRRAQTELARLLR